MLEKITNFIVETPRGTLEILQIRGDHKKHDQCNADHDSQIGDEIFWHGTDMNHTRKEGKIIEWQKHGWDWSKNPGFRATNILESKFYFLALQEYRLENKITRLNGQITKP